MRSDEARQNYPAVRLKVKQSLYSPGQARKVPGGWDSQISRQSAHEGSIIVSPTHRPPLLTRKYSWYSLLLEVESIPGPQCGWKDCVIEKFQWHHRESNLPPSSCEITQQKFKFLRPSLPTFRENIQVPLSRVEGLPLKMGWMVVPKRQ